MRHRGVNKAAQAMFDASDTDTSSPSNKAFFVSDRSPVFCDKPRLSWLRIAGSLLSLRALHGWNNSKQHATTSESP
jgi:hypothetical protein